MLQLFKGLFMENWTRKVIDNEEKYLQMKKKKFIYKNCWCYGLIDSCLVLYIV